MNLALRILWTVDGWGARLAVAKWMVCPTPGYLRSTYPASSAWQVPLYYVYRPLRFVARRLAGLGR